MGDLTQLIERVEKATKQNPSLDVDVLECLGWRFRTMEWNGQQVPTYGVVDSKGNEFETWPSVTGSLDAVVALVERERPYGLHAAQFFSNIFHSEDNNCYRWPETDVGPYLARKLLAALLRAKQAQP